MSKAKETIHYWKRRRRGLVEQVDFYKATETQKQHGAFLFTEATKFDKKEKASYVYICDCEQANLAAFGSLPKTYGGANPGRNHTFSMTPVKVTKNKTCVHCGYYAKLVNESEIGDMGAFGRGMRGKNRNLAKGATNV